jgi:hypothetical protein
MPVRAWSVAAERVGEFGLMPQEFDIRRPWRKRIERVTGVVNAIEMFECNGFR